MKVRVALYPEGPVTIYGDDEVDDVDQEHEGVDVAHWAVLRVDDVNTWCLTSLQALGGLFNFWCCEISE